jgi:hypothetical protein
MCKVAQTFDELANASGEGQEPERHRTSVRCLSLFGRWAVKLGEMAAVAEIVRPLSRGDKNCQKRLHSLSKIQEWDMRLLSR